MNFTETIKADIFADRFGGSRFTRFNQCQLEAINIFTKDVTDQLIEILSLRQAFMTVTEPPQIVPEPCWIDSIEESKTHFSSVIYQLNTWAKFITDEIRSLEQMSTWTRIRRTGKFKN